MILTLVVGLVGAVVLASLAGARRTSSAVTRFEDETLAADLTVFVPAVDEATIDELRRLPGVEAVGRGRQLTAMMNGQYLALGGPLDPAFGRTIERPRVLEGRLPRQDRVHEFAIPEPLAKATGLGIGDEFTLDAFTPDQVRETLEQNGADPGPPEGPSVPIRVVGVTRVPGDLSLEGSGGGLVLTTRAFVDRYGDQIGSFSGSALRVRTTDDGAAREFVRVARERTAELGSAGEFQVQPMSETQGAVRESIDVVASGLVVFALVAALAGLVVVGVVIRRFVDGGAADLPALRAFGASRSARVMGLALVVAPVAVIGPGVAVVGAWLASPIFPLGLARQAEPDLGLAVDPLVLALGFLVGVGLVAILALWSARGVVRRSLTLRAVDIAPSRVSGAAAGCPATVTVGLAMATDRGAGRSAVSARPAIAGTLVAVLGVVAVLTVGASLRELADSPRVYGYNWDAHVVVDDARRGDIDADCSAAQVEAVRDRAVAAAADTCSDTIEIEGYSITGVGFISLRGVVGPTVLEGRAPRAVNEVALGTNTFGHVDTSLGDWVHIVGSGRRGHRYRVVGRVVMPVFSAGDDQGGDVQAIADGATFTGDGLARITEGASGSSARVLVRWRPGVDVAAASDRIASLDGTHPPLVGLVPLEVDRLEQLDVLPWLLGAFLVLIGVLGVGFGMVTSVRRRAREIAVLKTIGFQRRQIEASIATQASVFAVAGLALGIPLGVIVGRFTWDRIASPAGFAVVTVVPLSIVAAVAAGTLAIVNVVAWVPARRAARLRPAVVLRSE